MSARELAQSIRSIARFDELLEEVRAGRNPTVRGPVGSAAALLTGVLIGELGTRVALVVCPGMEYAEEFAEDISLVHDGFACAFPPLEGLPGDEEAPNETIVKARLGVLRRLAFSADAAGEDAASHLATGGASVVCASINALLQPTCSLDELRRGTRTVAVGTRAAPEELIQWLVSSGFYSVPRVELPGQYSLRGGILDVFSHGMDRPVRIEFFGDQVDSIRTFDRASQLSSERIRSCGIAVSGDPLSDPTRGEASLLSYLPEDALVLVLEPDQLWERAGRLVVAADAEAPMLEPDELGVQLSQRRSIIFVATSAGAPAAEQLTDGEIEMPSRQRDSFGIDLEGTLAELARICTEFRRTHLFCISPAEERRLRGLLADRGFRPIDRIRFARGRLNHGALFTADGVALIPHHRLFGRYRQRRVLRHAEEARPIEALSELERGDLVVHVQHGIGRFRGAKVLEEDGRRQEHIEIEFADSVRVFVPADRIELVHKHIGLGGRTPALSKLHGAQWRAARRKAEHAVRDLAADLLHIQALRRTQPGLAAPPDDEWQHQFESEFPYEETEDQLRAIEEVKADMEAPRPMDRLICGDVGYGKTEIAMRAAFKAVMGGRQVAVLVPTTVLAQQHYRTFRERAVDYPLHAEMLSRFVSDSQARQILEGMADGRVDIVIGTHRLLQKDVSFKNLGLVIIDEEQRFGVEDKETLKRMRTTVDVLTLTATPIPRTLHMALMGIRDISSLQTPPLDRQAVETSVMRFNPKVLQHAVRRELSREGQVYMVHNRVDSIEAVAERVRKLVPEARVEVAHGQMPERQLADVMERFLTGEVDVLVSTTIVQNGLDIPNANTLIVNRADMLGLAQMHQLRGRVGRYIHKAHAHFFIPANRPITPEAQGRLDAIRRYCELGAGFDIALQDLEIRGAGNILGPEQSGHIAAIGYNLYCRLLARATAALKGETISEAPAVTLNVGLDALLPDTYVPTLQQRMEVYRELSRAADLEQVHHVAEEVRDRFGPPPVEAQNLLLEAEIRILADQAGITSIQKRDSRLYLVLRDATAVSDASRLLCAQPAAGMAGEDVVVLEAPLPEGDARAVALRLRRMLAHSGQEL